MGKHDFQVNDIVKYSLSRNSELGKETYTVRYINSNCIYK